ncbi:MAG TPA: outer membrane beta-barrel protein [Burkholderiales bacterium]|jgi:OOP family OmpA-OmpF porin|nr:outer membrane beta-barrel protein [Burkholderiales bacterium]
MKKILLAAAIAGAFVAAPASAQWYVGAGIGAARAKLGQSSASAGGVTVTAQGDDDYNTSGKVFGGYQFTPNWGVEGQYVYLGKTNVNVTSNFPVTGSGSYQSESWGLAATGTLPLPNNFFLMGKLGAAFNRVDNINGCASGAGTTVCLTGNNQHKTDLLAGVGGGYNFNAHWGIRLEYENFGKMTKSGNGTDIKGENWAVNVKYAF